MRRALRWLFPGAGVVLAAGAALRWAPDAILAEAARGYPWVAFALAFALAGLFHRTRPACLALLLAGVAWARSAPSPHPLTPAVLATTVALVAGLLALSRDRGLGAPAGLAQLAFTALVGGVGVTAALAPPDAVVTLLSAPSFPPALTAWTGLPEMTALVSAGALLSVGYAAVRRGGPVERGMPWFLAAVALGLHGSPGDVAATLWLLTAALVLALSVVETSYAMAYRDDLTGLPARRALMRDLEGLGSRYTLAMVDVDHFKKFNDRHGHDVGDQVLRMVASRLARVTGGGRAYRYGGEEFTVVFPGRSRDEAAPHLEALRAAVEAASFSLRSWTRPAAKPSKRSGARSRSKEAPKRLSVTVSVGVADAGGAGGSGGGAIPEAILKKADKALYRAKRGGRNRVAT